MTAALVTIAFGSTMAVKEVHWKRRLAYSTVSNLSYILFGATLMSPFGLAAALSHMVAHAFMKISAFFCAGAVMHKSGKTYIYQLDGMGRKMPIPFGCLTVASLSLMGIPLFAGFISKWNLAQAAFEYKDAGNWAGSAGFVGQWLPYVGVAVILFSALMTGIYMMTVLVRAYFPKADKAGSEMEKAVKEEENHTEVTDPTWKMLVPLMVFTVVILVIGMHSAPLMELLMRIGGEVG